MTPYEKIFLMNTLMGHEGVEPNSEEFWTQLRNQVSFIVEEAQEAHDETIDEDLEKLIKEVADVMVVAIGTYQKLQLCGIDITDALDRVCDNNLEKLHENPEHANETVKFYEEQGVSTFVRLTTMDDGKQYYAVIREGDNKMLKPHDYTKVSLSDIAENAIKLAEAVNNESDEQ